MSEDVTKYENLVIRNGKYVGINDYGLDYIVKIEQENFELKDQLQQKENVIKELNDKLEDDKMIIEGNWGCIDNLRKDYNLQKNIIKEVREYLRSNEWGIDYEHSNCRTHLLEILDKVEENK